MNFKSKIFWKLILLVLLLICFVGSVKVFAIGENSAKVYLTGPKESVAPLSKITIGVLFDSSVPVNAFDLEVNYGADKLKFLDSDNTNSIVDIWQTKPTSVTAGKVEFSGGILDTFQGKGGQIIKLSFEVLKTDLTRNTLSISFSKSDLYLADGKGTKAEVSSPVFSLKVKEDAKVISTPITPFQSTPTDILIDESLKNFKTEIEPSPKGYFVPIFFGIILVFCIIWVYNKYKRKL